MTEPSWTCLAACRPGVEAVLAEEMARHGLPAGDPEPGGVPFRGSAAEIVRANRVLATCSRVLVRLGRFRARGFAELERKAIALPWDRFPGNGPARFDVTSRKSRLYHTRAVAERLERMALGQNGSGPGTRFVVRIIRDVCEISADASGSPLHRRGYRLRTAKAPLRETVAAALLHLAWDPSTPLVDPFCGSGTIPIEGARWAAGIPPGSDRDLACLGWPGFSLDAPSPVAAARVPPVLAADRDAGAVEAARENADRARVGGAIDFRVQALSHLEPPEGGPGSVVTNPPWGRRTRGGDALSGRLGALLRARFRGWRVAVLSPDPTLPGRLRLDLRPELALTLGGVRVRAFVGVVP